MFAGPQEVASRLVKVNRRIEPTPGADQPYRRSIEVYDELFRALKGVYRKLSA